MTDLPHAKVRVGEIVEIVGVGKTMVYNTKKLEARDSLHRKSGSGGSNKILTDDFLVGILAEIEADPTKSMRKLTKDLNVGEKTIRNAVGKLGLFSYARRRHQLLSASAKNSRIERGQRLINWLKKKPSFCGPGLL